MDPVEMTEDAVVERLDRIAKATEKLLHLHQVAFFVVAFIAVAAVISTLNA